MWFEGSAYRCYGLGSSFFGDGGPCQGSSRRSCPAPRLSSSKATAGIWLKPTAARMLHD
jgi:hypothetical protein